MSGLMIPTFCDDATRGNCARRFRVLNNDNGLGGFVRVCGTHVLAFLRWVLILSPMALAVFV
ncbi:hypothetical protein PX554_20685 [Sphingomonas sp. H39-1-10]|uniref:hypothetical protein n=1 Tax=Sphingomonas pollutisoli TaxID=3030829 RepID=UPI0023BA2903|nr:hypothetical protein [Sphingomonas pollutisoli]MDF0490552.1 hypothetical protein [Sphingomonas pollutisoli]